MKRLSIILCFMFLVACENAYAADLNLSLETGASATGSHSSGSGEVTQGIPENVRDDNTGTVYGVQVTSPGGAIGCSYEVIVTLKEVSTINKIEVYHSFSTNGGGGGTWYIDVFYDGSWHNSEDTGTYNAVGSWTETHVQTYNNVTQIRFRDSGAVGGPPFPAMEITCGELRGWGRPKGRGFSLIF